jgi:hypothetical protein
LQQLIAAPCVGNDDIELKQSRFDDAREVDDSGHSPIVTKGGLTANALPEMALPAESRTRRRLLVR